MADAALAERAVIAQLIQNPDLMAQAIDEAITSDHFSNGDLRRLFAVMSELWKQSNYFGTVSLGAKIPNMTGTIHALMTERFVGSFQFHAATMHAATSRGALISALSSLLSKVNATPITETIDLNDEFLNIQKCVALKDARVQHFTTTTQALSGLDLAVEMRRSRCYGAPTGLKTLDACLNGGLQPGQLHVLAARPGGGKTTLALQVAIETALADTKVGFVSMEMTDDDLAASAVANMSGVDSQQIRNGIYPLHADKVDHARGVFKGMPMMFHQSTGEFTSVMRECRQWVRKQGVGLIVIDYLQLLRAPGNGKNRNEELTYISTNLKQLALQSKVPVLACAQMSRDVERRSNDDPRLSDIRDCGSIEQDADVVMFITRATMESPRSAVTLHLSKNRRGRTGPIEASGDYAIGKIWEIQGRDG